MVTTIRIFAETKPVLGEADGTGKFAEPARNISVDFLFNSYIVFGRALSRRVLSLYLSSPIRAPPVLRELP